MWYTISYKLRFGTQKDAGGVALGFSNRICGGC